MKALNEIKEIASELGALEVYETYRKRTVELEENSIRIGVIGGSCSGKTLLINGITGTKLPIQGYASSIGYEICYGKEEKCFLSGKLLESLDINAIPHGETVRVECTNEWLEEKQLIIREKIEKRFDDGDLSVNFHVSDLDVCVYIIDGLMPYTKNDALIIESLEKFGIPTLVVVSKMDHLHSNDELLNTSSVEDVTNYLSNCLAGKQNLTLFIGTRGQSLSNMTTEIKSHLEEIISSINKDEIRAAQNNLFVVDAIAALFKKSEELRKEIEEMENQVTANTEDKKNKVSSLEGEWVRIELELTKKRQECEEHFRKRLDGKKDDILRRISHELDTANDIKVYWERDLAFRIDETLRAESQNICQLINNDIVNTLRWLQDELQKTFKQKSFVAPSITFTTDESNVVFDNLEFADYKKLKIITRVGTATTVIVAGTLLATSGVAGALMAISMVSGIGAEWFMGRKTDESREKVKSVLPSIIDQAILGYVDKVSTSLRDSYADIIANLRKSQEVWKTEMEKEIEEEDKIAHYNIGIDKYNKIVEKLNQLSDTLLD